MSSVDELKAYIKKLSADIKRQKKILKDLEHNKRFYQRKLNDIRDPVARLPLEISSEIFLQCLPRYMPPSAHLAPMLLLNICNAWSEIAKSTPALWAAITVVFPRARGFQELLEIWLQRARFQPLSIFFTNAFDDNIADIVWRHGQQVKHLTICCDERERLEEPELDEGEDFEESEHFNILRCWSPPGPLPLLETLTLYHVTHDDAHGHARYYWEGPQLLTLLRLAPNLIECTFDGVQGVNGLHDVREMQVLPTLRRLTFARNEHYIHSEDDILKYLTIPSLDALFLSMHLVSGGDLLSFFTRSSPPLRELVVDLVSREENFTRLDECLRLVPTLTHLDLWCPSRRAMDEMFATLAQSPSLLPNLCSWTIWLDPAWNNPINPISSASWEDLLRALTARRTHIQIVHVAFERIFASELRKVAADILAELGELVAGGMELYFGPDRQNFISLYNDMSV
ncbi:hypothetical protein B0H11DRAFT_481017 [Mycena galericulata]|nr:hypothetical protein B0H11DRAFT_481017 [Mycena galericulata]